MLHALTDNPANQRLIEEVHPPDWVNPTPAGRYNLVVIGAGSGGLVTAAGAAGLGAKVALIEESLMGGDCLNFGCVPSKALIASSKRAKAARASGLASEDTGRELFKTAMAELREIRAHIAVVDGARRFTELGVDVFLGRGEFESDKTIRVGDTTLSFSRAVIATGGRAFVPPIDGLDTVPYLTNSSVFNLESLPNRLLVIGGGPIGCELAQSFARFGSAVTLVVRGARIMKRDDQDASQIAAAALIADGVTIVTEARLREITGKGVAMVERESGSEAFEFDEILIATGRQANTENLGLDAAGVKRNRRGVVVDARLRTSNRRVYAVGDVCSAFQFTHAAEAQARMVIRNALFFGRGDHTRLVIPWTTYTSPEVAGIGLVTGADDSTEVDTYTQDFEHVDRALTDQDTKGFVRIHCKAGSDRIVGASIVAPHAGEMISELSLAMTAGIGLAQLGNTIHPYPTYSLAVRQTADQYSRTRLTPFVAKLFRWLLAWRR